MSPERRKGAPWGAIELLGGLALITFSGGNPIAIAMGCGLIFVGFNTNH